MNVRIWSCKNDDCPVSESRLEPSSADDYETGAKEPCVFCGQAYCTVIEVERSEEEMAALDARVDEYWQEALDHV